MLFESGWTDIRHTSAEDVVAMRRDGSAYWSHSVSGEGNRGFYNAATDQVITLFPAKHAYSSRSPMIWHDQPYRRSRDGDMTCSTGILHNGTDFHLDREPRTMLGVKVFHWSRSQGNGGWEDIYVAPEVDCTALKHVLVLNNSLHLPRFIHVQEATALEFGEPPPDLFAVPTTYAEVPDPFAPYFRRFVGRNKR